MKWALGENVQQTDFILTQAEIMDMMVILQDVRFQKHHRRYMAWQGSIKQSAVIFKSVYEK